MIRFFCLISLLATYTQNAVSQENTESRYIFQKENMDRYTMPFETVNNLIIVKTTINNSSEFNFIIDSGVRNTLITSLEPQQTLIVKEGATIEVNGLGNNEPVNAYYSENNEIIIGKIKGYNQTLIVLLDDIFHLQSKLGMPVHGIIGYDLLKNFVIKVNYHAKEITFIKPEKFEYKKNMGELLEMNIFNKKPYIEAEINNCNDSTLKVKLLIDTGGSMPIWLFADEQNICKKSPTIKANLGTGLNGEILGEIGRINYLKIGNYEFTNPICNFPDSNSVYSVVTIDQRSGSLGAEVLKRFVFYMNYTNNQFIIKKNSYFNDEFNYNMSGIELEKPYQELPIYVISRVLPNTAAEIAGLMEGDQIHFLNGKKATELSLDDINSLFQSYDNKKINISYFRDGKEYKTQFRLKKII